MRVISGKYKGKKLEGFTINGTRPTMDRVKESLFGMIQTKVYDSECLDLFAGSGALGLESLSNGAKTCYFVDHNPKVIKVLKQNLANIENAYILDIDYKIALEKFHSQKIQFDIIFLDPPYDNHFISSAIAKIEKYSLLKPNGILICEYTDEKIECNLAIYKEKKYNDKNICIYINET